MSGSLVADTQMRPALPYRQGSTLRARGAHHGRRRARTKQEPSSCSTCFPALISTESVSAQKTIAATGAEDRWTPKQTETFFDHVVAHCSAHGSSPRRRAPPRGGGGL